MTVTIRRAVADDVPEIVALLADDSLGAKRESPDDLTPYQVAFKAVDADPNQLLVVVEHEGAVVGTAQLSYIPGLSRRGALRAQIEGRSRLPRWPRWPRGAARADRGCAGAQRPARHRSR